MTFRERTLAILAHRPVDKIVYQPRIEHWYNVNKNNGTLPQRYKEMSLLDIYDDLRCSIRTYPWFNCCLKVHEDPRVKVETVTVDQVRITRWETPVGTIESHHTFTDLASHTEKFPVSNPDDARVMEYILRGRTWSFDYELFEKNDKLIGDRAAPMIYIPRVNFQRLLIEIMGFEQTLYALYDDKPTVDRLVKVIDESDQQLLDVVCECPVQLINYGDNVDHHFATPRIYEEYILPAYLARSEKLHAAGKYTFAHWDGYIKNLLPYAQKSGLDGIEALTPVPQGDVTIEEIKEALGDVVLLDGIPMTCFLPHEPIEDLIAQTRKIIELFSPNLILGVSDEPSPVCDIERVRLVADIVNDLPEKPLQ
ncbi:MAG: uroporphyrinogen decarboxylase family protein [Armatimonadota bacterium]|nr:uroporphyrinogen decarboxylase family protein [Armatimonadota bacterium]